MFYLEQDQQPASFFAEDVANSGSGVDPLSSEYLDASFEIVGRGSKHFRVSTGQTLSFGDPIRRLCFFNFRQRLAKEKCRVESVEDLGQAVHLGEFDHVLLQAQAG